MLCKRRPVRPLVAVAVGLALLALLCCQVVAHPFGGVDIPSFQRAFESVKVRFDHSPHAAGDEEDGDGRPLNDLITDYSNDEDLVHIKYVKLDPEKPVRNSPLSVKSLAFVKERVEGAVADVYVKWGPIPVFSHQYDLCEELTLELNKTCPVERGDLLVSITADVPRFVPPGWYTVEASGHRVEDNKRIGKIVARVHF
ncbi:hypothetical protein EV182_006502 [Spiromyces aspiralis]|uniref:Uncharacterized protein n=1 Tax=Spiromyces aspiralis TaxID=68401 RepID=A0ACC1HCH2_9FUNG|nr:hypothetical protein EV182_006502 [Spiromyces aspiralis]